MTASPAARPSAHARHHTFWRALCLGAVLALGGLLGGCGWVTDQFIRHQISSSLEERFAVDPLRLRVLLCGTGSPEAADAGQACTLVAVGGRLFLFDAGENAARNLGRFGVAPARIDHVFLTHLHSDHFNGLGALVNQGWIWGRKTALPVAGPTGTQALTLGLAAAYATDVGLRHEHMPWLDPAAAVAKAQDFALAPGATAVRVYERDGVTIDAVPVCHEPVHPAFGYVLRYRNAKLFVSGDTKVCPRYAQAMQGADLVVHEAYATHLVRRALPILESLGQHRMAELAQLTTEYHADTRELARFAQQAGVKHLVLTHLTPAPGNWIARRLFVDGMNDTYSGTLTLGRDGEVIDLAL